MNNFIKHNWHDGDFVWLDDNLDDSDDSSHHQYDQSDSDRKDKDNTKRAVRFYDDDSSRQATYRSNRGSDFTRNYEGSTQQSLLQRSHYHTITTSSVNWHVSQYVHRFVLLHFCDVPYAPHYFYIECRQIILKLEYYPTLQQNNWAPIFAIGSSSFNKASWFSVWLLRGSSSDAIYFSTKNHRSVPHKLVIDHPQLPLSLWCALLHWGSFSFLLVYQHRVLQEIL